MFSVRGAADVLRAGDDAKRVGLRLWAVGSDWRVSLTDVKHSLTKFGCRISGSCV